MKWIGVLTAVALLCVAAAGGEPASSVQKLRFLAGSWQAEMGGGQFTAYYSTPEGGKVLSYNELRKAGKFVYHEFERFEESESKLTFFPYPGGKPATPLTLTVLEKERAVFENPKKDFPTRIEYRREKDRLVITLSDPHGGSDQVQKFDLKRAP